MSTTDEPSADETLAANLDEDPAAGPTLAADPEDTLAADVRARDVTGGPRPAAGLESGARIGRFLILDKLGQGGMGVVYAAYDPELDRKVALKLLLGDGEQARARLQREAQALARLAHPNIVAVHDVGALGEQIWVAMEFIDGVTLGEWLRERPRSWAEVLGVMIPAGRGLAAAHAAGLLHRDFKPDNVMVGRDGRVRVMDLGLARTVEDTSEAARAADDTPGHEHGLSPSGPNALALDLTQAGALLGTPAYMAPEQYRRAGVGTATDQFSYCVTLYEALWGERPFAGKTLVALATAITSGKRAPIPTGPRIPAWLRRTCLHGLATDPRERFASMAVLLAELERGQGRARTRRVAATLGVVAVIAGGVGLARQAQTARQTAACEAEGRAIATSWDAAARERVRAGLEAVGADYATTTLERVLPTLDTYAERWATARTQACLATEVDASADAEALARARWCLDERRLALVALVDTLAEADATVLAQAVPAALALAPIDTCEDRDQLARLPSPPSDLAAAEAVRQGLARSRAETAAGKYEDALAEARATASAAEALAWPPLIAAAQVEVGRGLVDTGAFEQAKPILEAAFFTAAVAGAEDVSAAAAMELAAVTGERLAQFEIGMLWVRHAEIALAALGVEPDSVVGLAIPQLRASLYVSKNDYALAGEELAELPAKLEAELGPEHPNVAASWANLADIHVDRREPERALPLLERALAVQERALGPDHPALVRTLQLLGDANERAGDDPASKAAYQRALAVAEAALGPEHHDVASVLASLAGLSWRIGEFDAGVEYNRRSREIVERLYGPDHPRVANAHEDLALIHSARGEHERELELLLEALRIREISLGPETEHVAGTLLNLGVAATALGQVERARAFNERALAIRVAIHGNDHVQVAEVLLNMAADIPFGDPEKARLYREAEPILLRALGADHINVALVRNNLAFVHLEDGHPELAKPLLEQVLVSFTTALGEEHPVVMHPLAGLARVALAEGDPSKALELATRGRALAGDDPSNQAEADFVLAQALWAAPADAGRDRERARTLASAARAFYGTVPSAGYELRQIDAWLRTHGGPLPG